MCTRSHICMRYSGTLGNCQKKKNEPKKKTLRATGLRLRTCTSTYDSISIDQKKEQCIVDSACRRPGNVRERAIQASRAQIGSPASRPAPGLCPATPDSSHLPVPNSLR